MGGVLNKSPAAKWEMGVRGVHSFVLITIPVGENRGVQAENSF